MSNDEWCRLNVAMSRYERRELAALEQEQVTHPLADYQPGSPRLERLYHAMESQRKYQWPSCLTFNV